MHDPVLLAQAKHAESLKKLAETILEVHRNLLEKIDGVNETIHKKVGPQGVPGYTPQKGKDYFTKEEIRAFAEYIVGSVTMPKDGITPVRGVDYFHEEDIQNLTEKVLASIRIPKDGENGKTPKRGVDYFHEKDIKSLTDAVLKKLPKPKDGKNAEVNVEEVVATLLNAPKGKRLTVNHIDGLREGIEQTARAFTAQLGKGYLHGGGDTVKAGTNVTLTKNSDGTTTISASGSGGGANVSTEKLTPTTSGSNITLNLTGLTHTFTAILGVYKNGQLLDPNDTSFGWSRSSNTITVLNATTDDVFLIQYTY